MPKSPPNPIRHIKLSDIRFDPATQVRAEIHEETVAEYAAGMIVGEEFPPVTLFQDAYHVYWIGDGWHRLRAAERNAVTTFPCTVEVGGRIAAIRHALSANAKHGLPRTTADKRHAIEIALREYPGISDREIGKICAVHNETVGAVRKTQVTIPSPETGRRIGSDGKSYPATHPPRSPETPSVSPTKVTTDNKTLAEWVKAHGDGMPMAEIARSYRVSEADVRGALQLPALESQRESPAASPSSATPPPAAQPPTPQLAEALPPVSTPMVSPPRPEPKETPWSIVHAIETVQASIEGQLARAPEAMVAELKAQLGAMCARVCGVTVLDKPADPFGDRKVIPPLPEWVTAYSTSIGYAMDGQKWCDAYEQKGWKIKGQRMKNWHAAVSVWKTNGYGAGTITMGTAPATRGKRIMR